MIVGVDLDGTLDSDPTDMQSLLSALHAAGHQIAVLTGASTDNPTQDDLDQKAEYLKELGMGSCWDRLVVFADPPAKKKAKWCKKNNVDILIDNNVDNAKAAAKYCTVLVTWNTITPKDKV